jgi:hypothetical protein
MKKNSLSQSLFALSCFGLFVFSPVLLTGCAGQKTENAEKKETAFTMQVVHIDQLGALEAKIPDGQYLVVKARLKNQGNKSLILAPTEFVLQNITDKEEERYSQPAETGLFNEFRTVYGEELKDKLVETTPVNLYPRMELERYFIFMVPSDAKIDGYQITHEPEKVSAPLVVTGTTTINDHRNTTSLPPTEEE